MGTSNFLNRNASSIFALEIEDNWDFEMQFDGIACTLADKLGYHSYCLDKAPTEPNSNRNFHGKVIGEKSRRKYDRERGVELIVTIKAIIRGGYYSGANLDWRLETETIHREPLTDEDTYWIESTREDLINELERAYKEHSTPLGVTARASNGTCMYHKK